MRRLFTLLALCLPLALHAAERPQVVTTFSILANLTRETGGDDIVLTNLVGADADTRVFEPSPRDLRQILAATC